jgi:hypothetical protein
MKNIKFLLLAVVALFISACQMPRATFYGNNFDAGSILGPAQPTEYAECELVPQFSFEKDEAMEIVIKCEESTSY